jgi:FlaA1/EpsC-like NDP-sugar epimerase
MVARTWRTVVLLAGETAVLAFAVALGSYLRLQDGDWMLQGDLAGILRVLLIVVVCQACLHYADLYDLRTIVDTRDLLVRLLQGLGATSLILAAIYFWLPDWMIGRGVFLYAAMLIISLILAWRLFFTWLTKHRRAARAIAARRHEPRQRRAGARAVRTAAGVGVEIVGFVDP